MCIRDSHEQGSGHDQRDYAFFVHRISGGGTERSGEEGLYHPIPARAIAERPTTPKSSVDPAGYPARSWRPAFRLSALMRQNAAAVTKYLCMAGKRFDLARRHAIDRRQPY